MTSQHRASLTAIVTGGSRRIGRAIALDLAGRGWRVAIHYGSQVAEAESVLAEVRAAGGEAAIFEADLADAQSAERLVSACVRVLGPPACLVNNASLFVEDGIQTLEPALLDRHFAINLRAPLLLAKSFAAALPDGIVGNIINIIDQRVWKLTPKFFSYTASKSALWTVTRTLAQALAPRIRVNAIGPGPALPNVRMDEEDFARQARLTLLKRGTSPEEISAAVVYILSAPAMTGQMIVLDGGQHLLWQTRDVTEVKE